MIQYAPFLALNSLLISAEKAKGVRGKAEGFPKKVFAGASVSSDHRRWGGAGGEARLVLCIHRGGGRMGDSVIGYEGTGGGGFHIASLGHGAKTHLFL